MPVRGVSRASAIGISLVMPLVFLLSACSISPRNSYTLSDIPPLFVQTGLLTANQAWANTGAFDLFALDEDVFAYVDRYVDVSMPPQQRAWMLHSILRSSAFLGIEYKPQSTYTAMQVYRKAEANCLAFANLYIALARHYGLKASYQMIESAPAWSRMNDVMAMNIHVNSVVHLPLNYMLVVDVGSDRGKELRAPRTISDKQAMALFYNNLSIDAYTNGDYPHAYGLIARAIDLAPDFAMLWSNLGALLRINQQLDDAEFAYRIALNIDGDYYTALNNLAVLFYRSGRMDQYDSILARIQSVRESNPYYHLLLAEQSVQDNQLLQATSHVRRAMELKHDDPEFQKLLDVINRRMVSAQKPAAGES